jgi:NADH-quinone oxidoreductase subunit L
MTVIADNIWLAVAVPFALAALVGLAGRALRPVAAWISMISPLVVAAVGIMLLAEENDLVRSFAWLVGGSDALTAGWLADGLVALMLTVVGVVAFMVMLFSVGYMEGDVGWSRYFALLSLFTGAMSLLVIADGFLVLFIGWELVGACSYLLIGFWFTKKSAADAAVKAFLVTRVGDVGLLFALAVLYREVGSLSYETVFASLGGLSVETITAVALLLFVGAAGKSAQFPLHIWLPDAMEGPTPVSALIHAATMVAAGVFLVARTWPIFEASELALNVVLLIGTFTALMSATVAVAQTDIKKVLAYSTISQLGFMFAALGAGAWVVAIFHLTTHAAFKALLFLGSGSVIHGTGTQDLREMGGLAKPMPYTTVTWIIGALALAGVPPLAGFFSKDEVIHSVWTSNTAAAIALLAASFLTAFYITRATRLAFFGESRSDAHPHEGGWVMRIPLLALASMTLALGFAGHAIAEVIGGHAESLDLTTAVISTAIAIAGIALGWWAYRDGAASESDIESRLAKTWSVLRAAYGFDVFVTRFIVAPTVAFCRWTYRVVDYEGIDGIAEGVASSARRLGGLMSDLQNGEAQWYAALIGAGAVGLTALILMLGG